MKKILITGAGSYVGTSFEKYVSQWPDDYHVDTLDMISETWREHDFSQYDVVFHVAGLAHSDVGNASEETKALYYKVNRDLAIETAEKAKKEGVKQFIFMSTMIIYGESAPVGKSKVITRETVPKPANFYGDSKWQADQQIRALAEGGFNVCVLRPPMIYGPGSKGNYQMLRKLALKLPVFPAIENERSMLYIDNLCEFLCQVIIRNQEGIFYPQNTEYARTSDMVRIIAEISGNKILISKGWNWIVGLAKLIPGKPSRLTNKAFGNLIYDQNISKYSFEYQIVDFRISIERTEQ